MNNKVTLGSDQLLKEKPLLKRNIGVLAHIASVCSNGTHVVDALYDKGANIKALFGPEHGLFTDIDYMEGVSDQIHPKYKIPIYSLYGNSFESLSPSEKSLEGIDLFVCDLQDVGSRYYTYVWTLILCMKTCAKIGIEVVVCDRPNPINGINVEGGGIEKGFESFVGLYSLPNRHGMTIGEIANYVNDKYKIGAKLHIIKMQNWKREMFWSDTGLLWTKPSPNMVSEDTALVYTGMCLLEGTNISEGRGTEKPFEVFGAPYFDSNQFIDELKKIDLKGVEFSPVEFVPTKDKWKNQKCFGVEIIIDDKKMFNSYLTGLAIVWLANKLYKEKGFMWRSDAYEFVKNIPAISLLAGTDSYIKNIDKSFEHVAIISKYDEGSKKELSAEFLY